MVLFESQSHNCGRHVNKHSTHSSNLQLHHEISMVWERYSLWVKPWTFGCIFGCFYCDPGLQYPAWPSHSTAFVSTAPSNCFSSELVQCVSITSCYVAWNEGLIKFNMAGVRNSKFILFVLKLLWVVTCCNRLSGCSSDSSQSTCFWAKSSVLTVCISNEFTR